MSGLWLLAPGAAAAQDVGVFVSSTTANGDLGGLSGADAICAGLGEVTFPGSGPWVAWLSDSSADARDRIASPGPGGAYVLAALPATVIAADLADLTDGALSSPIDRTELGVQVAANVWTGTGADGLKLTYPAQPTDYCADWTSASTADFARVGATFLTGSEWTTQDGTDPSPSSFGRCDGGAPLALDPKRLYCFGPMPAPVPTMPRAAWAALALLLLAYGSYLRRRAR